MTGYCFNILTGNKPPVVTPCMDLGSGACFIDIIDPCHPKSFSEGEINNTGLYAPYRPGSFIRINEGIVSAFRTPTFHHIT